METCWPTLSPTERSLSKRLTNRCTNPTISSHRWLKSKPATRHAWCGQKSCLRNHRRSRTWRSQNARTQTESTTQKICARPATVSTAGIRSLSNVHIPIGSSILWGCARRVTWATIIGGEATKCWFKWKQTLRKRQSRRQQICRLLRVHKRDKRLSELSYVSLISLKG